MVGIYAIKNKINNKIYIGRSTDIQRRWTTHLRDARKGSLCKIHIAMRKLGIENFYLEVIEECCEGQLNNLERYWQDFYNVLGRKGLNCKLTSTDDKTGYLSEETKKLLSEKEKRRG